MKLLTLLSAVLTLGAHAADLSAIPFNTITGEKSSLADYKGKVVLVVNTASKCGLTKQYTALEALQKKYTAQGFTVIAFPCNDFGGQEPGTAGEIVEFCKTRFDATPGRARRSGDPAPRRVWPGDQDPRRGPRERPSPRRALPPRAAP